MKDKLLSFLEQLEEIEQANGKYFESRAYNKAAETLMSYPNEITSLVDIKSLKNIGNKIYEKFEIFLQTNTHPMLEAAKNNPALIFTKIYGIGPKKAQELIKKHKMTTIEDLENNKTLLNDKQLMGLKYYDDILKKIPRKEIEEYEAKFKNIFNKIGSDKDHFEIVGSYRRGKKQSGDIDIIITNKEGNNTILKKIIAELKDTNILIETLSLGNIKSLTICKLPNYPINRRVDFMFSQPDEFAFSTLYFTGSKEFNVVQRKIANEQGYTLNEHGLSLLKSYKGNTKGTKIKGEKIKADFPDEKSIFDYLNMIYKTPEERKTGQDAILKLSTVKSPQNKKLTKLIKITNIKTRWDNVENNGISVLKNITEDDLCSMIKVASDQYYNGSKKQITTDTIFDMVKEYAINLYPNNIILTEIGYSIRDGTEKKKIKSKYYLPSMDKIKANTNEIEKYKKKYPGEKIISGKADGISALYTTESDTPILMTRGNATTGLDISHLIPYLNLPTVSNISVRGELIMKKKIFDTKYSSKYKNPRNMVSGIINSKKYDINIIKDIDFIGYEVIKPTLVPNEQMEWLENNKFDTIVYETKDDVSNETLSVILEDWRDNYIYEVDGIIVNDNKIHKRKNENPKHAIAFKMVLKDQEAEAKILDISWTASKDGYLKPVVLIEKVHLKGVDIQHVTAFNAKYVLDNNLGPGAIIKIRRSGDVIPHIDKIIYPAKKPLMPKVAWVWNESKVDAISTLENDPEILQKKIEFFFKKLDIKGVGPGNVSKLIKAGFNTLPKILAIKKDELISIEGIKQKTANKIYNNIHNKLDNMSLISVAAASNIFGRGIGSSIIRNILDEFPNILDSTEDTNTLVGKLSNIDNISKKRAALFVKHIPDFISFIKEAKLEDKLKDPNETKIDKTNPLYNKKIVITGPKDKTLKDHIIEKGGKLGSSVSKKTYMVLIETNEVDNNKTVLAKKLDIPVLTFDEFSKKYIV
jgi:DNA ligase (NAD+)